MAAATILEGTNHAWSGLSLEELRRGAKALVDGGLTRIPDRYILPPHQRPNYSQVLSCDNIPVIDLAGLDSGYENRAQVITDIAKACHNWGFYQVVNHGVPFAVMQKMMEVIQQFHELPTEEKLMDYSNDPARPRHFKTSFNPAKETTLQWRDSLLQLCFPDPGDEWWFENPLDYRDVAREYGKEVRVLAKRLLTAMSEGLGLSVDALNSAFGSYRQVYAGNYYPPCPNANLVLGLDSHSDPGGLTVLLQDQIGGLQVLHEGNWVSVKPIENAFVINVGDQIEILSNGKYKSVVHRAVLNTGKSPRISIPTFCSPSWDVRIAPISELLDESHPPLYREFIFGDYFKTFSSKALDGKSCMKLMSLPIEEKK